MKNSLIKNAVTLLRTPGMISHFGRYCIHRTPGLRGPSVKTASGGTVSLWEDFSDYWWGRKLSMLDEGEFALMQRMVKNANGKAVVGIDVGAHIGVFSIDMARAGFTSVHGFEANPRTFVRALSNIQQNNLRGIEGGTGANHVDVTGMENSRHRIRVPTISLDLYCQENQIESVQLVKIDVEGYEPWVVKGMSRLLENGRIEALIIEICPGTLDRTGSSVKDIAEPLNRAGYQLCTLSADGTPGKTMTLAELEAVRNLPLPFINVICVKKAI
jgi:FkbM family methyltransferase